MRALVAFLISSVAFASPQKTAPATPAEARYWPETTAIEGHLETHWEYGPPGFGETPKKDSHFKILVMRVDRPINVVPPRDAPKDSNDIDPKKDIRRVQLFCSDGVSGCDENLKQLTSCQVRVTGELHAQLEPMDFYPVNMDVRRMEKLNCPKLGG